MGRKKLNINRSKNRTIKKVNSNNSNAHIFENSDNDKSKNCDKKQFIIQVFIIEKYGFAFLT